MMRKIDWKEAEALQILEFISGVYLCQHSFWTVLPRYWKWETTAHGCLIAHIARTFSCIIMSPEKVCISVSIACTCMWEVVSRNGCFPLSVHILGPSVTAVPQARYRSQYASNFCHPQLNFPTDGTTTELKTNDTTGKYRKSRSTSDLFCGP